jgi:hypothetical protein
MATSFPITEYLHEVVGQDYIPMSLSFRVFPTSGRSFEFVGRAILPAAGFQPAQTPRGNAAAARIGCPTIASSTGHKSCFEHKS